MKIYALNENTTNLDLETEHGLSLYIETTHHKILFDMGQTDLFARNAVRLGIDLSQVDIAILSHGHYDHGGGLSTFLTLNDHAPVYIRPEAWGDFYSSPVKYIGLDASLNQNPRFIHLDSSIFKIDEELELICCNDLPEPYPADSYGLLKKTAEQWYPDDFRHEQYLMIQENEKTILLSGCSHKGILNIVAWLQPDVLIGGFHFKKLEPGCPELDTAARILSGSPTKYYTCHCTGIEQYLHMKQIMGDSLQYLACGDLLEL